MTDFGSRHKASHQDGGGDEISVAGLSGLLADEQDAGEIKGVEVDDTDIADGKGLTYNETSEKLEYETPAAGGDTYVDRGDPSAWDFTKADLTTDGAWHDLDLSAIVPAGAKLILITVMCNEDAVNKWFYLRQKGNSNDFNRSAIRQQVANLANEAVMMVSCDQNRKIQYLATNTVWTVIYIEVRGWFI